MLTVTDDLRIMSRGHLPFTILFVVGFVVSAKINLTIRDRTQAFNSKRFGGIADDGVVNF